MKLLLTGVKIAGKAKKSNILIDGNKISKISANKLAADKTIDLDGAVIMPSLVDLHTHSRQPGDDEKETLYTFSNAAVHGGITTVCSMPNTNPVVDNPAIVSWIINESKRIGIVDILPVASLTIGQKGKALTEAFALKKAGAVALSEDGRSIEDPRLMRSALEYARSAGLLVMLHSEEMRLSKGGAMNEGEASLELGIKPIPSIAETIGILRDLEIAVYVGARVHICHISLRRSAEIVHMYKKFSPNTITAETCPHYLIFTEEDVVGYSTNFKMNPPLRTQKDKNGLLSAVKSGKIDCIATDHAPHLSWEKENEFELAPFGIVGMETFLSSMITYFVNKGKLSWEDLIRLVCDNPRAILGMEKVKIKEGSRADLVVVDPNATWEVSEETLLSKGKNSPFLGKELQGKVLVTIRNGKIVYNA